MRTGGKEGDGRVKGGRDRERGKEEEVEKGRKGRGRRRWLGELPEVS